MSQTKFIQLHLLTSYPPSNLNRDDLGRPKTAIFGGTQRLRVSSQSLKRAWRDSCAFEGAVGAGNKGVRTLRVALERVYNPLLRANVSEERALAAAQIVRSAFETPEKGDAKGDGGGEKPTSKKKIDPLKALATSQLIFISPKQLALIDGYVEAVVDGESLDAAKVRSELLTNEGLGADVALFGRMMSANAKYTTEAAAQVAHAMTVHKVAVEDDYFSAVDDLNRAGEDAGAGHIGTNEFGAGLFYLYLCIDRELLLANLGDDETLATSAIRGLVESACTVSPIGKKATFASFARASYALAEVGPQQPRNLSTAFLKAVYGEDQLAVAIQALKETRSRMDAVYGPCADGVQEFDAHAGAGTLAGLLDFVAK